jgi:DNA-binding MarR family transcriptional regulator
MVAKPTRGKPASAPKRKAAVFHPDITSDFAPVFTPDQHVGTALRVTFRAFADAVADNLAPLGLSLNMWFVLRALWESDGLTQVDLAGRLNVTPAAMVGLVNSLEATALVERRRSEDDGRAYKVFLTQRGKSVRQQATRQALQVDARALRDVSVEETEMLLALLGKLRANLSA